jgi:small-conductance mechanosensitive channel
VHTVPHGELKALTNHSRDWVIVKLESHVTYDTDVDLVEKLLKRIGQQMLEDPQARPQPDRDAELARHQTSWPITASSSAQNSPRSRESSS